MKAFLTLIPFLFLSFFPSGICFIPPVLLAVHALHPDTATRTIVAIMFLWCFINACLLTLGKGGEINFYLATKIIRSRLSPNSPVEWSLWGDDKGESFLCNTLLLKSRLVPSRAVPAVESFRPVFDVSYPQQQRYSGFSCDCFSGILFSILLIDCCCFIVIHLQAAFCYGRGG